MIRRVAHLLTAVAVFAAAAAVVRPAAAQGAAPVRLLDVPYLPQTVLLCGGAAAAMVMRYWGATGVYAETFADLVIAAEGGIRGDDLRGALQHRGWDARAFRGDAPLVRQQLSERHPVIALIEDRPGTFHYVVLVGWADGRVIAHDPARAPFQIYDEQRFMDAWSRSGHFTLLALPGARTAEAIAPPPEAAAAARGPCDAMVDEGVRLAVAGDRRAGERVFDAAAIACPASAAPWRELAGLRVLERNWPGAARLAERAVALDPDDAHAWRIVATSRFLEGDGDGALAAWNAVGDPILDLVNVRGLDRTRYAVALEATGLEPQRVLSAAALARARRRLAELPSAQVARILYQPNEGGRAVVEATVLERPMLPTTMPAIAAIGVGALSERELRVVVASPSGGGETWTGAWRWQEGREALRVKFAAPGGPGVVRGVELYRAEESFATASGTVAEERSGATLSVADWSARGTRWAVGAGLERWVSGDRAAVFSADVQQRFDRDRLHLRGRTAIRLGGIRTYGVAAEADWRSSLAHEGIVYMVRSTVETVGDGAPLSVWPGAGIGAAREPLLRAHPLLEGGAIAGGTLGRTVVTGGAEWRWWRRAARGVLGVAPAAFVDVAKAERTRFPFSRDAQVDVGAGLRIAIPGAGVIRLDVARGLRDGAVAWSLGWAR